MRRSNFNWPAVCKVRPARPLGVNLKMCAPDTKRAVFLQMKKYPGMIEFIQQTTEVFGEMESVEFEDSAK